MIRVAKALIVTALTTAVWLYVVKYQHTLTPESEECRVGYVYDGDTIAMDCGGGDVTARIVGLDTPETKGPRCAEELAHGKKATLRLRELVKDAQEIKIYRKGRDKYNRDLIRLVVDGADVADTLIDEGLAVKYGWGRRPNWCETLKG